MATAQAMQAAAATLLLIAVNAAVLSPGETPTVEWLMAAAVRAWGGRAVQAADEVGQIGSVLTARRRGRATRIVLIA
eukprot:15438760-Alexandrium_andersonii.AAC.1